jgi:glycosyltransferase involved in cell wall biosynthesis
MTQENKKLKLLVFVVAYNAETTIEKVLKRIPKDIYDIYETNVLIIDDSSCDKTFEVGVSVSRILPNKNITVIRNPENQGYGGNQKIGYNYAIKYGYDIVILLHGDAQYAPEYMPALVEPIAQNKADAVFGSRMLKKGEALKGGMPIYKYVGNKILTGFQNRLMGVCLSEWHSGYRAYSISALKNIPFERNENGFPFDTDIILQLIQRMARIAEVPIPTYYGGEICHVSGLRYAFQVSLNTLRCKLHNMNLFYERKYDCYQVKDAYPLKLGYPSSHSMVIDLIKEKSRVLDIGCGQGLLVRELAKKGCSVVGVDSIEPADTGFFQEFIRHKLPSDECPWNKNYRFDYVLLLDVIEHMVEPEKFMDQLREWLQGQPCRVIITSGNVSFWVTRLQLLFGRFNYVKRGILDMTHLRLFTLGTLKRLVVQSGYKVLGIKGIPAPFPEVVCWRHFGIFLAKLNQWIIPLGKSFFSYQVLLITKPYPNLDFLLLESLRHSEERKSIML